MFESLKKKLKNWLGTEEKKPTKNKKTKKEKKVKDVKKTKQKKTEKGQEVTPLVESVQEKEEKNKEGFFGKLFAKASSKKITESDFNELFYELELALLESNVALEVVDALKKELQTRLIGAELKKENLVKEITKQLNESIKTLLKEPQDLLDTIKKKQGIFTILFFGINGSGKTTSLAKLAYYLKKNNVSCVMAAGDTFRAASIEQLETHGHRIKIPVVKQQYGADPAAVAFDAKKYAQSHGIKVVLIDTAGRMYTRDNLMKEMEKIVRVSQPDLKLFVGESITGNDATEQARMFNETAGIDGIILTKADIDEKGGAALSVSHVTKKPIYFLGTGQEYDDLKPFKKEEFIKNLGL